MAKPQPGTRASIKSSISQYIGSGKEFTLTELPTLREVLRYGVFLQEKYKIEHDKDYRNYSIQDVAKDVLPSLLAQWKRANCEFKPPVIIQESSICRKIIKEWETARDISRKRISKKGQIEYFSIKLDKLFDLCKYQCPIKPCDEINCNGCINQVHVVCQCSRDEKIPILELPFMKAQREKIGVKSSMQIGLNDAKESNSQNKLQKRKLVIEKRSIMKKTCDQIELEKLHVKQQEYTNECIAEEFMEKEKEGQVCLTSTRSPVNMLSIQGRIGYFLGQPHGCTQPALSWPGG